ncbi:uncharacterized protein AC631_03737 [Debaryomyces fabryi]|uniref:Uncharacterized protein n=1 Tax=Debaryomyces fabryi TaxID=58627 RepID=A0A0V1PWN9_9ASCO|nr:uncharacterized protein AC631_03737 [Debaryomyces fabryi]KSA00506.1 hypothetical protein AC631_03737 [Debaryomyces fabryi]CUM45579.1 unnamed protein product [Debaryomyces fabryi]
MAAEILYNTPDFDPGSNLNQLIKSILDYQLKRQADESIRIKKNYSANDFISKVNNLEEYFYDSISYLSKLQQKDHQFLWLISLESLTTVLYKYKVFYYENLLNDSYVDRHEIYNTNHVLATIATKLERITGFFKDLTNQFFTEHISIGKFISSGTYSTIIINKLFNFITTSFKLLTIDEAEDMLYTNEVTPTVAYIGKFLSVYYAYIEGLEEVAKQELSNEMFPTLTEFIKTVYIIGESKLILPFMEAGDDLNPIVNPKTPIKVIQSSTIDFTFLKDYYKYTAFNLLALSLSKEACIEHEYSVQSDIYFRVLLSFPNLSTTVYERFEISNNQSENLCDTSQLQERIQPDSIEFSSVSLLERQEISLLFILNYLLQLSELRNLIEPEQHYKSELKFLIRSLSTSISQDIHVSASRSGSLHPSTTPSYAQLNMLDTNSRPKQVNNIKFVSLSSIILHGTYKEKLIMIIGFCEKLNQKSLNIPHIIERFNLDSNLENDFQHLVSMIDAEKYPGKLLYAKTISKITRLLKMISIKHLVQSAGINNVPESYLNKLFCSREPLSVSSEVKKVVKFVQYNNANQEVIIRFEPLSNSAHSNIDSSIRKQINNYNTTKELEKLSDHLK